MEECCLRDGYVEPGIAISRALKVRDEARDKDKGSRAWDALADGEFGDFAGRVQ